MTNRPAESGSSRLRYQDLCRRVIPGLILALALLPVQGLGQGTTASVGGTVTDPTGAVVPQAQIVLQNEATGDKRTSVSNDSGVFTFASVPTGSYDITITAPGFRPFEQTAIHLDPGDQRSVRDIHLTPGGATETVEVTTAANTINLDSGEQSALISSEEIQHLSVEGRDVTELLKILPGFAIAHGGGGAIDNQAYDPSQVNPTGALGQYSANGTPLNGQALLSDGIDITDPGAFGGALMNVNYEQVAEVKVQTSSFTADVAHGPIVINAVGKSGGSTFHGSLYTFARTYQLDSTDWLANYTGQAKPPDREVYPGFTIGGPVTIPGTKINQSKKLTFFAGAEDYAQRNVYAYGSASGAILTALVPTAGMRTGDFSHDQMVQYLGVNGNAYSQTAPGSATSPAGTYTPETGCGTRQDANICRLPVTAPDGTALVSNNIGPYIDPLSKLIINGMPLPNTASNGSYNWITTNLEGNNLWQARGRMDYAASERNKFFGVYSIEKGDAGVPQVEYYSPRNGTMGGINTPGGGLLSVFGSHVASFNWTSIISPSLTNEFYAAGAYTHQVFTPRDLSSTQNNPYQGVFNNGSKTQPELGDYGSDGLPLSLLPDATFGGIFAKKQIRIGGDNVTKVVRQHTLRGGVFYQWDSNPQVTPFINTNGTVTEYYIGETFTDPVAGVVHSTGAVGSGNGGNFLADFMEGQIFQYSQTNIQPAPNLYFWNLAGYAQDHWRITPRLTIDVGVRLEHFTPWADSHNLGIPIFDPAAYAAGTNGTVAPGVLWNKIDSTVPMGGRATRWAFVEPRGGLAWDAYGNGGTIVRAGAGIYRAHDSYNDVNSSMNTVLGERSYSVQGPLLLSSVSSYQPKATVVGGFSPDGNVYAFTRNDDEEPRVRTYNVSVDQRLPGKMLLEVAYVGNESDKLLNDGSTQTTQLDDLNSLPVGSLFTAQPNSRTDTAATAGTLYPEFQPPAGGNNTSVGSLDQAHIDTYKKYSLYNHVYVPVHNAYANYNGLQVGLTRQAGRAHYNVNYTFSKALGVLGVGGSSNNGYPPDPFNYHNDYMNETYDRRHIFNAAWSLELGNVVRNNFVGLATNGWEVSSIANYQSGPNLPSIDNSNFSLGGSVIVPVGTVATIGSNTSTCAVAAGSTAANPTCTIPVSNTDVLGTPDVNLQPTIIGDPKATTAPHHYVNGNAFGLPGLGQQGVYRYGFLPGPGYFDTDLTLAKRFRVTEKSSVQLRVAAFNFINHGNNSFTTVNGQQVQLNFNTSASTQDANQALGTARNQYSQFGYAPLREGRRIMELALRYDF